MTITPVLSVSGLSKRFRILHHAEQNRTLREEIASAVVGAVTRPLKALSGRSGDEFEDFWALRDVSFNVSEGERLGIVGRNGAGKSTLLKILSRITELTEGRVVLKGRVSSLLEVGTGFHPELTGRENIFLNGSILGMKFEEVRRKFEQIVDFAEIERFLDTPVKRYSSGMYVRLAFAVAAHLEPDVMIVDEVLAVGDASFQRKCLGRMEELSQTGRTILFVTHNMDAMVALCSRAVIIEKGRLVFDGSPAEARQQYLSQVSSEQYSVERNAGRGGSGGVEISHVWIDGTQHDAIESGQPLALCVEATVEEQYRNRRDLQVAFGIDTLDGQRIFTVLSSWEEGDDIDCSKGAFSVVCDIDQLPIIPGRYLVSATVLFRGDTLDSVQHCATFGVNPRRRTMHLERMKEWGPLDLPCTFKNIS